MVGTGAFLFNKDESLWDSKTSYRNSFILFFNYFLFNKSESLWDSNISYRNSFIFLRRFLIAFTYCSCYYESACRGGIFPSPTVERLKIDYLNIFR